MLLLSVVIALAAVSAGCLVRETVSEDGEVISDR